MPITSAQIIFKLSTKSGTAGSSQAQADPNQSLGSYVSTTEIVDATLNNLFDDVSGDENAASDVEYRCYFVVNTHPSLTLQSPVAWLSSEVAGGADAAIGIDATATTPSGFNGVQASSVVDESTAPAAVSFSSPTTKGGGLALSDLPASGVKAIWVRRTANNTAALNNDGVTIRVEGDTAA